MNSWLGGLNILLHHTIVELRKSKKITQEELAMKIGVSRSALSQYELGSRQPDYDIIKRIADFFGVSTDYLLGREESKGYDKNKTNFIIDGLVKKYNLDLSIEGEREKLEQFIKLYADLRNS